MPSPFPGMNPYLEQTDVWHDFHQSFITALRDALTPQIRPRYLAKIDENVYIHEPPAENRFVLGRPDVAVLSREPRHSGTGAAIADIAAPAHGRVFATVEAEHEPFIEIRDTENRDLITVIELLSPGNKENAPDRYQYIGKRNRILTSAVHLVEIDLLRGGPRMPVEGFPHCDYAVMVSRCDDRPQVDLWPMRLRDRLPKIPIPLRKEDRDVALDLQPLLDKVYDAAGYDDYIYRGAPRPPLHPTDAKWAEELIASRGK